MGSEGLLGKQHEQRGKTKSFLAKKKYEKGREGRQGLRDAQAYKSKKYMNKERRKKRGKEK